MYNRLFGSIVHSTIWREPDYVRLVWITMLAMSDKKGCVWAAVPGLADAARVSMEDCEKALERLLAPDPYSRTQEQEGRRIEVIDGGWFLINHKKFHSIKNVDERRESVRLAVQRHRAKKAHEQENVINPEINVIPGNDLKSDVSEVSPPNQTIPNKTRQKKSIPQPTADEQIILDHYMTKHPTFRPGDAAVKAVRSARGRGYSVEAICYAIDGNATDSWSQRESMHALPFLLGEKHIDRYIAKGTPQVMVTDKGLPSPAAMRILRG